MLLICSLRIYAYDAQGRLIGSAMNGVPREVYGYSANGERLVSRIPGRGGMAQTSCVYGRAGRVVQAGAVQYQYDAQGRLAHTISKRPQEGETLYEYDTVGNLIAVLLPDGRAVQYVCRSRASFDGKA